MEFKNKNILILGGNSDIAMSLIRDLIKLESNIFFTCKNERTVLAIEKKIKNNYQVNSKGYPLDILKLSEHKSFWNKLEIEPDILISCIGYLNKTSISSYNQSDTLKTINVNFLGLVNLFNIIAYHFKKRGFGVIVGISSVAGERGRKSNFIYGSAKSGFTTYLSGLRNSLYHDNINVITVLPGPVKTKMTKNIKISKYLSTNTNTVSSYIIEAIKSKKNIVFVKWYWRLIIIVIKIIPESIFKKLNL